MAPATQDVFGYLLIASMVVVSVPVGGFMASFGVFVNDFDQTYCKPNDCLVFLGFASAGATAIAQVLTTAVCPMTTIIQAPIIFFLGIIFAIISLVATSFITKIYWLLLTYSGLYGLGYAMVYEAPLLTVDKYFPTGHPRCGMAFSIMEVGPPIGVIIMNPLSAYLNSVESHEYHDTLVIIAGIIVITGAIHLFVLILCEYQAGSPLCACPGACPCCPREITEKYEVMEEPTLGQYCYDPGFVQGLRSAFQLENVAWCLALFFISVAILIPKMYFMTVLGSLGVPPIQASRTLAYGGVAELITTLFMAVAGNTLGIHVMGIYTCGSVIMALCNIGVIVYMDVTMATVYAIMNGAFDGFLLTVLYGVILHLTKYNMEATMTVVNLSNVSVGLGQLAGLPLAGYFYDIFKSFKPMFGMATVSYFLAALLLGFVYFRLLRRKILQEVTK